MAITLSDRERQLIALFETETGATVNDCVFDDERDQVLLVIAPGEMGQAIGPDGQTVKRVESRIGRSITLIQDADRPETFVANALAPAAVYDVTIVDEGDDRVAVATVDNDDKGVAIGADGRNIAGAKLLAARHFDVTDIRLK